MPETNALISISEMLKASAEERGKIARSAYQEMIRFAQHSTIKRIFEGIAEEKYQKKHDLTDKQIEVIFVLAYHYLDTYQKVETWLAPEETFGEMQERQDREDEEYWQDRMLREAAIEEENERKAAYHTPSDGCYPR